MSLDKLSKTGQTKKKIFIISACLSIIALLCLFYLVMDNEREKVPNRPPELTEEQKKDRKELYDRMFPELSEEDLKPVQDPPLDLY